MKKYLFIGAVLLAMTLVVVPAMRSRATTLLVKTNPATGITQTSALLNGIVASGGGAGVDAWFDWSGMAVAGSWTGAYHNMADNSPYTESLSGLTCGTTYTFKAKAISLSTVYGATLSFTTAPCVVVLPTVTTNAATSVGASTATLNGTFGPTGSAPGATISFEYGTTVSYGATVSATFVAPANPDFYSNLTGLPCGTTYHYRAVETSTAGAGHGSDMTFATTACSASTPSVSTVAATATTASGSTLNGNLTALGGASVTDTVGFQYGSTTMYGSTVSAGTRTTTGAFNAPVTGLACGTTYHYRASAANSAGTAVGSDLTFTTGPCAVCTITSFVATPTTLTDVGLSSLLTWTTTNCTSVTITGLTTGGASSTQPANNTTGLTTGPLPVTTTFTLTAR